MISQQTRSPATLRNAFYELALANQAPDAELLDEFVRRYPEHAAELTDFAIELALDAATAVDAQSETETVPTDSVAVSKAMSRFQNRLYAVQREAAVQGRQPVIVDNPFLSLDRAGLRAIGQRLNANNVFVMKLRDRQIDEKTMTPGFQCLVAEELKVPINVVVTHFSGPVEIQAGVHFKADGKPETGAKQTFEEAVRSCGLTSDQETHLLSL
jgi:hypothetical protein